MSRFYFGAPRAAKPKSGPTLKSLLVRCPSTSRLTDTGRIVDEKGWPDAKIKSNKVSCSHCGGVHIWTKKDVILGRPSR